MGRTGEDVYLIIYVSFNLRLEKNPIDGEKYIHIGRVFSVCVGVCERVCVGVFVCVWFEGWLKLKN